MSPPRRAECSAAQEMKVGARTVCRPWLRLAELAAVEARSIDVWSSSSDEEGARHRSAQSTFGDGARSRAVRDSASCANAPATAPIARASSRPLRSDEGRREEHPRSYERAAGGVAPDASGRARARRARRPTSSGQRARGSRTAARMQWRARAQFSARVRDAAWRDGRPRFLKARRELRAGGAWRRAATWRVVRRRPGISVLRGARLRSPPRRRAAGRAGARAEAAIAEFKSMCSATMCAAPDQTREN